MATHTAVPPETHSVIFASEHTWSDQDWMANRPADLSDRPMSVYEVHLGSWRKGRSYDDLARELVGYVVDAGFTHVEFLPSWSTRSALVGLQVTSYYAPTSRFGDPDGFRRLVDALHRAGIA